MYKRDVVILFEEIGCSDCHVPTLMTSDGQPIHPYSDFLLHDMGEALADGLVRGAASGREYRTQPLWGLSLSSAFLHDGQAETIESAIILHGGEAESSRDNFESMSDTDRSDLVVFLDSL